MSHSLEDNPRLISMGELSARVCEEIDLPNAAIVFRLLVEALKHTHAIAVAGWLDTEEQSNEEQASQG